MLEKQIQELNYQLEDDQRSYEAALNDKDAQIRKLREECQALMVELQMLLDTKQVSSTIVFKLNILFMLISDQNVYFRHFFFLNFSLYFYY